jgi:hypothetical protein
MAPPFRCKVVLVSRLAPVVAVVGVLTAAAACDTGGAGGAGGAGGVRFERAAPPDSARVGAADEPPLRTARTPEPPLGPGDARVASTDTAVVLVLRGDSVRLRLGALLADSIRRTVRESVDSAVGNNAIARMATRIATQVTDQVAGGAIAVAVTDIRRVSATDTTLHIETRGGGDFNIGGTRRRRDGRDAERRNEFAPGELPRFAAAIEARRRALAGGSGSR